MQAKSKRYQYLTPQHRGARICGSSHEKKVSIETPLLKMMPTMLIISIKSA